MHSIANMDMSLVLYKDVLAALLGGAVGSAARFLLSYYVQTILPKNFPWGIFVVNIVGCFLAGLLCGFLQHRFALSSFYRSLLFIGFLGGFTTLSSVILDTVLFWQSHAYGLASVYVLASLGVSLSATAFGIWLVQ